MGDGDWCKIARCPKFDKLVGCTAYEPTRYCEIAVKLENKKEGGDADG